MLIYVLLQYVNDDLFTITRMGTMHASTIPVVPDDEFDRHELRPYPISEQVIDLLEGLRAAREAVDGRAIADVWRSEIDGVCIADDEVFCVTVNRIQLFDHWLIPWLNERLQREWPAITNASGTRVKVLRPHRQPEAAASPMSIVARGPTIIGDFWQRTRNPTKPTLVTEPPDITDDGTAENIGMGLIRFTEIADRADPKEHLFLSHAADYLAGRPGEEFGTDDLVHIVRHYIHVAMMIPMSRIPELDACIDLLCDLRSRTGDALLGYDRRLFMSRERDGWAYWTSPSL
jgi:hypothetical protein